MSILAVELSTAHASMALLNDTRNEAETTVRVMEWPNDRKNSGPFFENLQTIVQEFGLPQKIIVGLGPGSYAGIRIAISAAIGLQAAARTQLIGYPSICAMPVPNSEYI